MGRLITNINYSNNSTKPPIDVHIFVDKSGNVNQIRKVIKDRLKFYIDPVLPPDDFNVCAIGVSEPFSDDCTDGVALGLNFNLMATYNYL